MLSNLSKLSKVINNVKDIIQTNVITPISNNLQNKPSLGKVKLHDRELEEIKLISQGGYAYVYQVRDSSTGETFALKKMICQNDERLKTAKNEIKILKSIPSHPNLLRLYDAQIIKVPDGHHAYLLLEFCEGGSLFDLMMKYESAKLNEKQIVFIMREVIEGVKALHSCNPPIFHRDLKIDNVLLQNKKFKLCDFGSCSSGVTDFAEISRKEYALYEEEFDKNTTLMYRPPEMCDPYQKYVVNDRVDIWMIGCILYMLCFYKHPFQEASKLSIVNAAFTFPKEHPYPEKLIDIIRMMLTPNPIHRPSIFELANIFKDYFAIETIKLNPEAQKMKDEQINKDKEARSSINQSKSSKAEEDIPIEELMKIQSKVQQAQKRKTKSKEPEYKDWTEVQYPSYAGTQDQAAPSHDDWSDFSTGTQNQQPKNKDTFDDFHDFSSVPTKSDEKENKQPWEAFDFTATTTATATQSNKIEQTNSSSDAAWGFGHWETPEFKSNDNGNVKNEEGVNTNKDNNLLFGEAENKSEQKEEFDFL